MPRKTNSDDAADWLFVAGGDLAMVRNSLDDDAAYPGCQAKLAEALEKVLKAALVGLGWPLVKTHNLMLLADELSVRDAGLESAARPLCEALAEYYLGTRYPGFDLDDPDWPVLRLQLEAITALAASVRARLKVS